MKLLKQLKTILSDKFQLIGPAIMPVIAILPVAALLMGIGSAMQQEALTNILSFLTNDGIQKFAILLNSIGSLIIGNLGVLFAVGIAMNLSGKSGVAALSSLVCYLVMHKTIELTLGLSVESLAISGYANVLGIYTFQCGVFGGLIVGIVVAWLYNKFHEIELPQSLAFFQGEKFIPIISVIAGIALGFILILIWPPIQGVFEAFTNWLINTPFRFICVFLYGFVMRLAQAFGLQHLIYPFFYFQMGEYVTSTGQVVTGDSSIFFAQMADKVDITVGGFMTGSYIATVCCIAIAFAMYKTAKPERKNKVKGVLLGVAFTAALTGITEPIEFSFLLISPVLWVVYCGLVGLGYALTDLLQIRLGTALAGNGIDYILYGVLPQAKNYLLFIPLAIAFFIATYFIFKIYIVKRDLKTIGREDDEDIKFQHALENSDTELPRNVLAYLGGPSNIKSITNCITRVRAKVYDRSIIDIENYKIIGAKAVVTPGTDNVQLVYGGASEKIANTIKKLINGNQIETIDLNANEIHENIAVDDINCVAVAEGELILIEAVADEIFSEKIVGDGYAIIPKKGTIVSPMDANIDSVFPTNHAICLKNKDGLEILLHLGIDTVELNGKGFDIKIKPGDFVKAGQVIAEMDLEYIKSQDKDTVILQIFSNLKGKTIKVNPKSYIELGSKIQVKVQ